MRALLLLLLLASAASAQTGTIAGTVLEADGVTAIIGANVHIEGTTLSAATDLDGNYRIIGIPAGTYAVRASYAGYASQTAQGVGINAGSFTLYNFTLSGRYDECGLVCCYVPPIITNSPFASRIIYGNGINPPNYGSNCGCGGAGVVAGG